MDRDLRLFRPFAQQTALDGFAKKFSIRNNRWNYVLLATYPQRDLIAVKGVPPYRSGFYFFPGNAKYGLPKEITHGNSLVI